MSILQVMVQEQQAISLVMLGLLSLCVALVFRACTEGGLKTLMEKQAFWLLQAAMTLTGGAMIIWPSWAFAAFLLALGACGAILIRLNQRIACRARS